MGVRRTTGTDEIPDRLDRHDKPAGKQDASLTERSKVLGAAVSVGMLGVRRLAPQPHSEERQDRRNDVSA